VAAGADQIAAALENTSPAMQEEAVDRVIMAQEHAVYDASLPGMHIEISAACHCWQSADGPKQKIRRFHSERKEPFSRRPPIGQDALWRTVCAHSSSSFGLLCFFPGARSWTVEFQLLEPLEAPNTNVLKYTLSGRDFQVAANVIDRRRSLRPPQGFGTRMSPG